MALTQGSRWFIGVAMLAVAGVFGGLWWIDENVFVTDVEPGQPVEYTVERGATVRAVGDDLAELGVVRSSVRFRLAADEAGLAGVLQPGVFELETGMDNDDVIDVLAAGPLQPPTVRFTVAEGLPVSLTLERLAEQFEAHTVEDFRAVLDQRTEEGAEGGGLVLPDWVPEPAEVGDEVEDPYEGLLWPETYEIVEDAGPLEILQMMVDQLRREMDAIPEQQVTALDELGLSRYEALIVASLVERESLLADERAQISGVVANRLEAGMRLQIDATVLYAVGEHRAIVSLDDLELDHPYNTYVIDGLPPGPISGVGRAALQAAFDPAEHDHLFYVLAPECDGSHRFAESADEHEVNVAAFREADRCQEQEDELLEGGDDG